MSGAARSARRQRAKARPRRWPFPVVALPHTAPAHLRAHQTKCERSALPTIARLWGARWMAATLTRPGWRTDGRRPTSLEKGLNSLAGRAPPVRRWHVPPLRQQGPGARKLRLADDLTGLKALWNHPSGRIDNELHKIPWIPDGIDWDDVQSGVRDKANLMLHLILAPRGSAASRQRVLRLDSWRSKYGCK